MCTTRGSAWATPKMKNNFFLAEITKADHQLKKNLFYQKFWLSYESFSILCDVFFIKKGSFPAKTAEILSLFYYKRWLSCLTATGKSKKLYNSNKCTEH